MTDTELAKEVLAVKGSGMLPEKQDNPFTVGSQGYYSTEYYNKAIDETALKLAKFLSGLQKKIGELLYYRICEDGVSINLPPDMPEKFYCNVLAKAITDHIKSKIGINKK